MWIVLSIRRTIWGCPMIGCLCLLLAASLSSSFSPSPCIINLKSINGIVSTLGSSVHNVEDEASVSKRHRQIRRQKHEKRRPRYYWSNPNNIRRELEEFWTMQGVTTRQKGKKHKITIPNEVLLMHYDRHDLRAAIQKYGGREVVAQMIGNADIMPGRWQDAVEDSKALQELLKVDSSLSGAQPPRVCTSSAIANRSMDVPRWTHQDSRNPKGYWCLRTVICELYEYVDQYHKEHTRPSVWFPRQSELAANGRADLREAMNRFGGAARICQTAGMVPHREWYYFDGQLEMLMELKDYLDEHGDGDYETFPVVAAVKRNGYHQLHTLIQYFGGRKFLAARLGMRCSRLKIKGGHGTSSGVSSSKSMSNYDSSILKFGSFDLDFAIRLMIFVREDHGQRSPPLTHPVLAMPRRSKLRSKSEGQWLDEKIELYGGYENVARRLGLALFPTEPWSGRLP